MTGQGRQTWLATLGLRLRALIGGLPRPTGRFNFHPQPYSIGDPSHGRDLAKGIYDFSGFRIEAPETGLFDLPAQSDTLSDAVQGFGWLDHLAADGTALARQKAQDWVLTWVDRYGTTAGQVDLTGRRLLRMLLHSEFLIDGMDDDQIAKLINSMGRQATQLHLDWGRTAHGLSRFEALAGLLFAGLCLEGLNRHVEPALRALDAEAQSWVDDHGRIPTRNPEELLHILCLLIWIEHVLAEVHRAPGVGVTEAIVRIAPVLRSLRHADGSLARFHGGGRGPEGWLDFALAQSGVRRLDPNPLSMGVARLAALRSTLMVDCAAPPPPEHAHLAHASALAFELTSGRRPIIVSCGSGRSMGTDWQQVGRETAAHSTLVVNGHSQGDFTPTRRGQKGLPPLQNAPGQVWADVVESEVGKGVECWHDGYRSRYGLIHSRLLALSSNGRVLAGQDTLAAVTDSDRQKLTETSDGLHGMPFSIHFHLHPDVEVIPGSDGRVVTLALASGENWVFRHDGHRILSVDPSTYLDGGDLRPIPAKQLILKGRLLKDAVQVNWSLAKDDETPQGIRDLVQDGASTND